MRWPVPAAVLLGASIVVPGSVAAGGAETIAVISITTSVHRVDHLPRGVSDGDTISSTDRLLNAKAQFGKQPGARIGSDHGRFTYTSTHSASYAGEASLPGGTVTVRGAVLVRADGQLMIPIVGGSGRYQGAIGFVTIGPGKKRVLNTYDLTLPGASAA
jgi:allene oxide cyclase-like protein